MTGLLGAIAAILKIFIQPSATAQAMPENYSTNGSPIASNAILSTNVSVAPSRNEIISFEQDIPFFGGWRRTGGDDDMNTNGDDKIPVRATTTLTNDSKRIWLVVTFSCQEDGGNHTAFSGTQKKVLFEAKGARTIEAVHFSGDNTVSFKDTSKGKNHLWTAFPASQVNSSYWTRFGYRIDTPAKDDSKFVGVVGRISFRFELK